MQPASRLPEERGITVEVLLLERAATGELPARVHAVTPLAEAADAYEAMAKGGVRGRIVLVP